MKYFSYFKCFRRNPQLYTDVEWVDPKVDCLLDLMTRQQMV